MIQSKKCDTWFEMTNSLKVCLSQFTETHKSVSEKGKAYTVEVFCLANSVYDFLKRISESEVAVSAPTLPIQLMVTLGMEEVIKNVVRAARSILRF